MDLKNHPSFSFKYKFIVLGIFIANYIINYYFNIFLTHHYNTETYGIISLIFVALTLSTTFILQGSHLSCIRFLPEYLSAHEIDKFEGFRSWARRILFFSSIFILVIGTVIIILSLYLRKFNFIFFGHINFTIFPFWLIPLFALTAFQASVLLSMQKQVLSVISNGFLFLITIIILLFLNFYIKNLKIYYTFISIGFGLLVTILLQEFFIKYFLNKEHKKLHKISISMADKKIWRHVSIHLMINSIIYIGIFSLDTLMLKFLGISNTIIGEFSVLMVLTGVFLLIQNASISILSPLITPLIRNNNLGGLQLIMNRSFVFRFFLGLIMLLIFFIYGREILNNFGSLYISLYNYLIILSIVFFINLNCGFSITLLTLSGHQSSVTKIITLQFIIVLLLNLILIPIYHLSGAIFTLSVGIITTQLLAVALVRYYLGLKILFLI